MLPAAAALGALGLADQDPNVVDGRLGCLGIQGGIGADLHVGHDEQIRPLALKLLAQRQLIAKGDSDIGSSDATKIKVGLNVTAPEGTGATVTYQMWGSNNSDFSEAVEVGSSTADPSTLSIPLTGTTYKYYKVKATIAY